MLMCLEQVEKLGGNRQKVYANTFKCYASEERNQLIGKVRKLVQDRGPEELEL